MAYIRKQQVAEIINNRPPDTTPEEIVVALRQQGHQLEGYIDTTEAEPKEKGLLSRAITGLANITGVKKLAEGTAAAINAPRNQQLQAQAAAQTEKTRTDLIEAIRKNKAQGKSTERLETALLQLNDSSTETTQRFNQLADLGVSNRDVVGSAIKTVGTIASFGTYGAGAKGATSFSRLRNVPGAPALTSATTKIRGAVEGAKAGMKVGAKSGSIFGALQGFGTGIEDEEAGVGQVIGSAVGGAAAGGIAGAAVGGLVGAVGGVVQARNNFRRALEEKVGNTNTPFVQRIKKAAEETADELKDSVDEVRAIKIQNQAKEAGETVVERAGTPSAEAALFKRDPKTGKIIDDIDAKRLIQVTGLEDGDVAMIKSGTAKDRLEYKKMLDIADELKDNPALIAQKKPTQVAGKNALTKIRAVQAEKNEAGRNIGKLVREKLADKTLKTDNVYTKWVDDLAEDGVTITDKGKINFKGSRYEDVKGAQDLILKAHKKAIQLRGSTNAVKAHNFKAQLDELVDYGNSEGGLSGSATRLVKGLRKGIDSQLDEGFTVYKTANQRYADASTALKRIESLVGKKTMQADDVVIERKLGQVLQRLFSNTETTALDLTTTLDDVTAKLGIVSDDTITNQAYFARLLEDIYGAPKNSMAGRVAQGVGESAQKFDGIRRLAKAPLETAVNTTLDVWDAGKIEKADALRKYIEQLIAQSAK